MTLVSTSLQRPLSSVPMVAVVETFNCILNQARMHSKVNEHMTTKNMYIFLAHCLEQGHKFTTFCLEHVQSLTDSALPSPPPPVNLRDTCMQGNLGYHQ